jgi:hypothetical protein
MLTREPGAAEAHEARSSKRIGIGSNIFRTVTGWGETDPDFRDLQDTCDFRIQIPEKR